MQILREKARDIMTENTKLTESAELDRDSSENTQSILDFGSAMTRTAHGNVYCLSVIGQIEGHTTASNQTKTTKYEHILPLLAKLEESDEVDGILFLLNTVGGDVEAGLAIAEMIAGMTKPTVSLVLGGSHSIGVPLAVAAQRSFAVPSAAMTIHPIRMSGTVIAAPQTYHYFERLQERIVEFVSGHSRISAEKFQSLMLKKEDMAADVGSVIYGEEAVSLGIVDAVGGLSDGLQYLYRRIDEQKGKERA
jgi:ATP-dependent protease ClpP protease subunit